jgi:hypothetical protein
VTPNNVILVLRDAVEVPVGAQENLTVGNGWRRGARLAQVIHGQKFELLRIGPKNGPAQVPDTGYGKRPVVTKPGAQPRGLPRMLCNLITSATLAP